MVALLLKKIKKTRETEEGFTLVELMMVVILIGVLVAVSVPIFNTFQKNSMEASVKQDIRNAAMLLKTESAKTAGRTLSYVPNFNTTSPDNSVIMDASKSNQWYFCLMGQNEKLDTIYYYSSKIGKVTTDACPVLGGTTGGSGGSGGSGGTGSTTIPGEKSFDVLRQEQLADKKVIITWNVNITTTQIGQLKSYLQAQGYGTIDTIDATAFTSMTQTQLNAYDVAILYGQKWYVGGNKEKLNNFYNQGGKIVQEGNDTASGDSALLTGGRFIGNANAVYNPTYNKGTNPPFPYTFTAEAFPTDGNWNCVTSVASWAVVIAETRYTDLTCATIVAAANNNGGQWVYMANFNGLTGPTKQVFDWVVNYK